MLVLQTQGDCFRWLGCKWTLVVSQVAYMPYIAAQAYAKFYTLVPAALLVGLGAGPLWCSQSVYIKTLAEVYAEHEGRPTDTILARFFGIFFTFYQTSEVWGNLISSSVFSADKSHEDNSNINISTHISETCGYNFCPGSEATESNPNLERPANEKIYTVAGIYLSCMILASFIISFGVTSLKRYNKEGSTISAEVSGVRLMAVTVEQLSDHRLLLLLPLTVWMGIEQVFRGADYTSGYVSCSWGISNIGYVLICYGVTNSLASLSTGYLVKLTGRLLMVLSATVIQIGVTVTLYVWTPDPVNSSAVFFVISGLWGITDAVWLVQMNALYGTLFQGNETAAYCNYRTWKSVGFIVAYAYSPKLCANVKLHIVLTMLIIGTVGFCIVEWLSRPHIKDKK
ncbi:UNC93-like protein isoform X2 [Zootermopsis nevadensis]|uniref:UNC93-like protein isoform X2 n=1 Tax=Zootermopsis nevadensis TaxID=136037 RepID=UPI000B8EAB8C|nr:UNC93-like protein isoform X2 [Zootermopsis nevadensis]